MMDDYSVIPFYSLAESLHLIMDKHKLTGINFHIWKVYFRNVLSAQAKLYVVDNMPLVRPDFKASDDQLDVYYKYQKDKSDVISLLLLSFSSELTDELREKSTHEVVRMYDGMFHDYLRIEHFSVMRDILLNRMKEAQSFSDYLIEIRRQFDHLESFDYLVTEDQLVMFE